MAIPADHDNKVPYMLQQDTTTEEITLTAKNILLERSQRTTVEEAIADLKSKVDELLDIVKGTDEVKGLKERVNTLENTIIPEYKLTTDDIISVLGYMPAPEGQWTAFKGAKGSTSTSAGIPGSMGLVPQPEVSDENRYLCGNGQWRPINIDQFITQEEADNRYLKIVTAANTYANQDNLSVNYYTKAQSDGRFLGISDTAVRATTADTALNVPNEDKNGNIWIKES